MACATHGSGSSITKKLHDDASGLAVGRVVPCIWATGTASYGYGPTSPPTGGRPRIDRRNAGQTFINP